jgi:8-oxo-dGTP diphosphatase
MYQPVLATLAYLLTPDRQRVLMIHRNRRPDDPHFGKYNGLGGKLEPNEDLVSCVCREVREEAGLECERLRLRGTVSWPGFEADGVDWFGFIFLVDRWHGQLVESSPEGELEWVSIRQLGQLPLWEGDRHFLPMVFEETDRQFHGVMPYQDGRPLSWSYHLVE